MHNKYIRKLHIELVDGEYENPVKGQVRDPQQVYSVFKTLKDKAQETLLGVYCKDDLDVAAYHVLSVGGEDTALIIPREVFANCFLLRAYYFILIHNHPNGKATPSPQDREVMAALAEQAKTLNLKFLDFIIVGEDSYWSMFEEEAGGEYALGTIT